MTQPRLSTRRQLELMQQLQQLADERAEAEVRIAATLETQRTAAQQEYESTSEKLAQQSAQRRRELENEFAQAKSAAREQFRQTQQNIEQQRQQQRKHIEKTYRQTTLAIERKKKESEWQALAVFDAAKDTPRQMLDEAANRLQASRLQVDGLQRDANTLMAMRRLNRAAQALEQESTNANIEDDLPEGENESAEDRLQTTAHRLHQEVLDLQSQRLPSLLLEGYRPIGWWVLACVLTTLPMGWLTGWSVWRWPLATLLVATAITGVVYVVLGRRGRRQSLDQFARISTLLNRARELQQTVLEEAQARSRQEAEAISLAKHHDLAAAKDLRDQVIADAESRQAADLQRIEADFHAGLEQAIGERDTALAVAEEKFPPLLDQLAEQRRTLAQQNEDRYQQQRNQAQQTHDAAWTAMADRWRSGFQEVVDELAAMRAVCQRLFPDWSVTDWSTWSRPSEPPPAMLLGRCLLPLQAVKNGLSNDPRLVPEQTRLELPALMTLDEQPRLVITADGAGRAAAVEVLQAMMLRFLTAMPAGKLRFTILDPTALGENFAAFMHLNDFDEQLVGGRIWTDAKQIDEQLARLSDHMEKVLQKYLRNEFETIHDYNQHAGEVAEPYHVLVAANYPAGLSDASIRKLATIAATGPRCGVYTLLSIDRQIKLPGAFNLQELLADAVHLEWVEDRLRWSYPLYEKLPLELDRLPPRDRLNDLLRAAGEESRQASRVEVPFSLVAPAEEQLWSESTAEELVVPIGRAGANQLQSLRLGRGTSQHALIAGKTGSGKSTLLHALITNLALHYSPDEVEFYLIDFKKGVEFKAYATGGLPHARVIAIESEREFGVSVLERLDEELRRRGELFRKLGVQDLAGYRRKRSEESEQVPDLRPPTSDLSLPLPRILLIIDEFQELFVTDDKLSQDAALLLDRLVRQGRAFGMHVLLGSQTLAGAYSLARSTLGQMAVRIALECSDADAHLILSDENTAARLLSRPGEAIYNDQNGRVEGNSLFQVAWLPDDQRQQYLTRIRDQLHARDYSMQPPIVFEGNAPADLRDNETLVSLIQRTGEDDVAEPTIWLGSAVRIEPPTQLTLRRQSGNHLLVVGGQEPLALGILASSVVALAAQQHTGEARWTVLDGTRPESSEQGAWSEIAAALPCDVQLVCPREAGVAVTTLADEVVRRGKSPHQHDPPHFLVIHDLAQFRELRLTEEDFGFTTSHGTNGKTPAVDKRFRDLLRDGPAVGIHVLVWADSYNSLTRVIDRLTLRELDYRVALQMSAGDSTSLIDSPAASRLGEHRAILYRDDLGSQTKFRPYGRPTAEWLAWVGEQLAAERSTTS